jgi:4-hydroxyacetophenone monooxygenase
MENVPFYFNWYRFKLSWTFNDKVHPSLQRDPSWPHADRSVNEINEGHRRFFTRYIERELEGRPDLFVKAMPDYPPFGKRMLLDNGWYRALRMPNVELITDAVSALDSTGVVSQEGTHREVDVVVFATGFEAQRPTYPMEIRGLGGRTLREAWDDDDARAYLGVSSPGFPNLFFMYGPNTNLGHGGSFTFLAERQGRYIVDLLCGALGGGWTVMDCKPDVHDRYNEELDAAHERMIWTHPGMTTWYRNRRGRVVTNMPWRVVEYWAMTRRARLDDYKLTWDGAEGDRSATTAQTHDLGSVSRT